MSATVLSAAGAAAAGEDCSLVCPQCGSSCQESCSQSCSDDLSSCSPLKPVSSYQLCDPSRPALTSWDGTFKSDDGPPGYDKPLSTNRPSFTPSVTPVGAGVFQLESGYTYTHHTNGPYDQHQYPEINPRLGLLDWVEVFGRWSYANQVPTVGGLSGDSGTNDGAAGFKIYVTPQRGILPQFALQPEITFPFRPPSAGNAPQGDVPWRPGCWGIYNWQLDKQWTVGGTTRLYEQLDTKTYDPYLQVAQSAIVKYQPNDYVTTFGEWFAYMPDGANTVLPQHYAQTGVLLRTPKNLQFDARVGCGLNGPADDFFTGAGVSARF